MKEIVTMGLGKVGTLVGVLLSKKYNVLGIDKQKPHYDFDLPFTVVEGDLSNEEFIRKVLEGKDIGLFIGSFISFLSRTKILTRAG